MEKPEVVKTVESSLEKNAAGLALAGVAVGVVGWIAGTVRWQEVLALWGVALAFFALSFLVTAGYGAARWILAVIVAEGVVGLVVWMLRESDSWGWWDGLRVVAFLWILMMPVSSLVLLLGADCRAWFRYLDESERDRGE
jgi:hypothetical protein